MTKNQTLAEWIVANAGDMDLRYDRSCEESMLQDIVLRAKIEVSKGHEPKPSQDLPEQQLWRHDWKMLLGGAYICMRCKTQSMDKHDAPLCSVRPDAVRTKLNP